MKNRVYIALMLAALCITVFSGCASEPAQIQPAAELPTEPEQVGVIFDHAYMRGNSTTLVDAKMNFGEGAVPEDQAPSHTMRVDAETFIENDSVPLAPAPETEQLLTKEEARDIALNHAGLAVSDVTALRVEFDRDDGRREYEVEFRNGFYEYDYEINALTGEIHKSEIEVAD